MAEIAEIEEQQQIIRKIGRVVGIHGAVVDVHFPGELPEIHNAMIIKEGNEELVLEVFEHQPNRTVRALAMGHSTGLKVGLEVEDTGGVLLVPVGPELLGRMVNIFGKPLDDGEEVKTETKHPIYVPSPDFTGVKNTNEIIIKTGIRILFLIINLLSPNFCISRKILRRS